MGSRSPRPARPIRSGRYPAKELCSQCGLCDTRYVAHVKEACAFLNQQLTQLEEQTHGRSRESLRSGSLAVTDTDYFGVYEAMYTARKRDPIPGGPVDGHCQQHWHEGPHHWLGGRGGVRAGG